VALAPEMPREFWERPELQAAFVQERFGLVLRAYRLARGGEVTQAQIAEWLEISDVQVSRLERGLCAANDLSKLARWARALRIPPRYLWFGVPGARSDGDAEQTTDPDLPAASGGLTNRAPARSKNLLSPGMREDDDPMKRRTLVSASLTAPFAAVFGKVKTYVTVDRARQIRLMVPELSKLDDQGGGEAVCQAAQWCLHKVDTLLNQVDYGELAGRELQSAYGEMAEMTGWLQFDAGRYEDARFYYGEALRAAQLAEDLSLEVLTLASMNTLSRYQGRPREAIQLIRLAQRRAAGWAPPRLAALLSAREAVCWAQLGDAGASRNAMQRAHHAFHPDLREEDPHWLTFFDAAELSARRATASGYLGLPDQAASAMQAAVDGLAPQFQRNRASYSVRLGLLLFAQGDAVRACEVVSPVVPLFTQVRSGRAHVQLGEFGQHLRASTSPAARNLLERIRTVQIAGQAT